MANRLAGAGGACAVADRVFTTVWPSFFDRMVDMSAVTKSSLPLPSLLVLFLLIGAPVETLCWRTDGQAGKEGGAQRQTE